jgi:hypothetical protein
MKYIAQPQYVANTVEIYALPVAEGDAPVLTLGPNWSADIIALTGNPNHIVVDSNTEYFGPNSALIYEDNSGVSTSLYLFVAFTAQNGAGGVSVFDLGVLLSSPPPAGATPSELQSQLQLAFGPIGMAIQPGTGNLYVGTTNSSNTNSAVAVFAMTQGAPGQKDVWATASVNILTFVDDGLAGVVSNLAFDRHGNLWLTTFDSGGNYLSCFTNLPAAPVAPLPGQNAPYPYLLLNNGDTLPSTLIAPNLASQGFPAPPATPPSLYPLSAPEGIAFDPAGNLWLSNNNNEYLDDKNPKPNDNSAGGGSLLMISGEWLDSLLYPALNAEANSTSGLAIPAGSVTTYYLNDNAQFGGLCFDGYELYINDENNYFTSSVVWQCDTSYVSNPSNSNLVDFQNSFKFSQVSTKNPGNGSMSIFNYPYTSPTLTIRDIVGDVGDQPDAAIAGGVSGVLWESPDILVSNSSAPPPGVTFHTPVPLSTNPPTPPFDTTGVVDPGSDAYIAVRVTNFGSAPSTDTEVLKLYYGFASTGLNWPAPWDGSSFYNGALPLGGVIGETQLPVIPGLNEIYVQIVWPASEIPDPANFWQAAGGDVVQAGHFCLLARIESASVYPFGMSHPEQVGAVSSATALHANVLNNSAIAWRNIAVKDVGGGETFGPDYSLHVLGANYGPLGKHFTFGIQTLGRSGKVEPINAKVVVKAEGQALERLLATKFDERRFRFLGEGRFEALDAERGMSKIHLPANTLLPFTLEFRPPEHLRDFAVRVIQYLHTDGIEQVCGGQTFVIGTVEGFPTRAK